MKIKDPKIKEFFDFNNFIEDIREMCDNCWCPKFGGKTWMIAEGHKEEYKKCTQDLEAQINAD